MQADTDLGTSSSTTPLSSAHSALSTAMPGPRDDAHVVTHRTARVTYPVVPRPQGAEHSVHGETCTQVGRSKRRRATKCSTFHITTNAHRSNQPWMPLMKTELTCHGSFRGCKVHPPHLLSASHAHSRPPPPKWHHPTHINRHRRMQALTFTSVRAQSLQLNARKPCVTPTITHTSHPHKQLL